MGGIVVYSMRITARNHKVIDDLKIRLELIEGVSCDVFSQSGINGFDIFIIYITLEITKISAKLIKDIVRNVLCKYHDSDVEINDIKIHGYSDEEVRNILDIVWNINQRDGREGKK